ncbi:MAG: outer membrane protein assembly factor BamA [Bacteroidetes bacterium]|nr:outer membrane protein assembly factor BamA [Bacteroidota bacterium]MBU1421662.1 outer membrane protein assembly factor BamA [Bacteroidota bacterium]MBU2635734.1 outer membrane protein assembly factor BamA [Bacteroidota bacterium]
MQTITKIFFLIVLFSIIPHTVYSQAPKYSGQAPKQEIYKILGISVEGNTTAEAGAVIANSGLRTGTEITVPGDQIRQAIQRLWALRLFEDIQILIDSKVGDGVYLLIKVKEHPRLLRVEFKGNDDLSESDLMKKVTISKGQILTPQETAKIKNAFKKLYDEEGLLLAEIQPDTFVEDSTKPNHVVLRFNIDEGKKVKIKEILVTGNQAFSASDIRGEMEDTKEKVWWMFWRSAKFDKSKYEADKSKIEKFYKKNGYLDAEITSDSIWYDETKRRMTIQLNINEGNQFKIRNITWEGSTVYHPSVLSQRLGFTKGDIYDFEKFEKNLRGNENQTDVASLYLDNGYLTFSLEPEEKRISSDSIDINIRVYERNQFRIGRVDLKGNTKTMDKVIRRELYTRPGDFFSRAAIMRSARQLTQLNYFNPEKIKPDYRLFDEKTVNLIYEVEEKSSDNINASVGYSGAFGVTGALGFTINNFDIQQPLRGGAGQILNFEWQFGEGARFRTFSLGFTEPWLFDSPTTFGVSLFDSRQIFYYDLRQTGGSVRFGRRFKFPDDYFRGDWITRFQINDVIDGGGIYLEGKTSQYSITQIISRNSTDNPIFPAMGSSFALSTEISGGPVLPGNVDYHKWSFSGDWYTPMFGSTRFVLYTGSQIGFIDGFKRDSNIPPIEYFFMGGTGLGFVSTTPLRGYEDRSVGPTDELNQIKGGKAMAKYVAELRFSVTMNPMPIYILAFAEAGNVYENLNRIDFLNLKRSYGFGARILIQPIGMVGFDYGYGADDVLPKDGKPDGWRFHFQFGRGF